MGVPYAEVIGDPIAHSKSPLIHQFWLDKLGLEGDYRATRIPSEALGEYFEDRAADPDWRGCNISMPHKLAARSYVFYRQDPSFPLWPINLAYRDDDGSLKGDDFDGPGFVASLMKLGASPGARARAFAGKSGSALILGAGGAARLVAWGLAHFGYDPIWIHNRDKEKAERFASDYRAIGGRVLPEHAATPAVDLLVNATPLGMAGQPEADIDIDPLPAHAIVYDLVYEPAETGLLRRSRERGLFTMNGLSMLVEQAAPSFRRLFGTMPPREHDDELRELLTR
jgi:shikimate dehydrogenase